MISLHFSSILPRKNRKNVQSDPTSTGDASKHHKHSTPLSFDLVDDRYCTGDVCELVVTSASERYETGCKGKEPFLQKKQAFGPDKSAHIHAAPEKRNISFEQLKKAWSVRGKRAAATTIISTANTSEPGSDAEERLQASEVCTPFEQCEELPEATSVDQIIVQDPTDLGAFDLCTKGDDDCASV